MDSRFELLDKLISDKRPELAEALLPGISHESLDLLDICLPDTLRALWSWHNGQSPNYYGDFHSSSNEMLMSVENAIEVKLELNELSESGDISSENWDESWLPFTENGGGNYMCISLLNGEVFYYDKHLVSTGKRFSSFQEWLANLISGYNEL